ncbi:exosortase A [Parasphingopyxis algicola]|uniref:exosortase A n=1 Tax=Parasphingopyxis algicola TaxID=2026624 RepID=UPI0015A2FB00|nr:exosortase A [Parasphingopyxis algicola]QLC24099.1 exosortase A [Parasphingopyxis algicola]
MTASDTLDRPSAAGAVGAWRPSLVLLAAAAAGLLLLFRGDAADMVSVWWNSSTFNHCLLIIPIIGWLVWNRKAELAELTPSASPYGLAIVALGSQSWLLGEAAGVALARHLGVVVMLQGAVVSILGLTVTRGLLFPLAYALFLVPFGEEFVPFLQEITAELSMILLGLFGLPAHMEGVFITTPSGYFEVAEACSGVKFLIAMVALGALAANLCFRSWRRRGAFLALCIVMPIVANGIRAFATIYIADATGIEFAENFDHVVYGWFFFAFVIAAVLALGWTFFDRDIDDPAFDPAEIEPRKPLTHGPNRRYAMTLAVFAIAVISPVWMAGNAAAARDTVPAPFSAPQIAGWARSSAPMAYPWRATYAGADRLLETRYSDAAGRVVDLAIGYYANPVEGREPVGFGQGGLPAETEWSWSENSAPPPSGRAYRIMAPGPVAREVFQYVMVGDRLTAGGGRAKLATLRARLLGGDRRAVGIVISAEGREVRAAIEEFIADSGGVEQLVDRVTGLAD